MELDLGGGQAGTGRNQSRLLFGHMQALREVEHRDRRRFFMGSGQRNRSIGGVTGTHWQQGQYQPTDRLDSKTASNLAWMLHGLHPPQG